MHLIKKGAEADIYETDKGILKTRISKGYRVPELDEKLRKLRTRAEARILQKAKQSGVSVPEVLQHGQNISDLVLEKVGGELVKEVLSEKNFKQIAEETAKQVALLHEIGVVHGDLTTSNLIWSKGKITLIDFGLAKHSAKPEDKAVDLHVLEETLQSTHMEVADLFLKTFLEEYRKQNKNSKEVLQRLELLHERGRYKKH